MTVSSKVRIYDLAKELKLDTKRLIEEVRREGVDVSVPSNAVSKELAEKIRNKYFPRKETTSSEPKVRTKEQLVADLLADLGSTEELIRFVRFGPDGQELSARLPVGTPVRVLAAEIVDLFRRHGLVDANFFERLADVRPEWADRIRQVEQEWVLQPGSTAPVTHKAQPLKVDQQSAPSRVFVSYSHRDRSFVDELTSHLRLLQRQGIVHLWADSEITAGQEWRSAIEEELEKADVILLMVSANFLASDFCWGVELKRALERHHKGTAVVIPVLLRPCLWQEAPFSRLQAVPRDAKPIASHRDTDQAWVDVASAIREVVSKRFKPGENP
jgi:hypothetical protein